MGFLGDINKKDGKKEGVKAEAAAKPAAAFADKGIVDVPKPAPAAPTLQSSKAGESGLTPISDSCIEQVPDDIDSAPATTPGSATPSGPAIVSSVDRQIDAEMGAVPEPPAAAPEPTVDADAIRAMLARRASQPPSAPGPAQQPARRSKPPPPPPAKVPSLAAPDPADFAPPPAPAPVAAPVMDSKLAMMAAAGSSSNVPPTAPPAPKASAPGSAGPKGPEKAWKKWTKRVLGGALVVALAALLAHNCMGRKVTPVPPTIVKGCDSPQVCMTDPKPKSCNLQTGQPFGMYFDTSCGYCGQTDAKGKYVRQPWMTKESCPVIFACKDDQKQKGAIYGGVYTKDDKGNFSATVAVLNKCDKKDPNYCGIEVCEPGKAAGTGGGRVPSGDNSGNTVVAPPPPQTGLVTCNNKILGTLARRIGGAVQGSAGDIRTKLHKGPSDEVRVSVGVTIDSSAHGTITSITADGQNIASVVSIDLGGVPIPTPESACSGTIPVKISAE